MIELIKERTIVKKNRIITIQREERDGRVYMRAKVRKLRRGGQVAKNT